MWDRILRLPEEVERPIKDCPRVREPQGVASAFREIHARVVVDA
jgi:hypothetical protein